MEKEKIKFVISLPATIEKELQEEMNETTFALASTQFDNIFFVMPDEKEKTITILPSVFGSVLRLGIKEAEALAKIIQDQIQEWK